MFRKKILIIGDSNCLPKYNFDKKNQIILENTYLYRLKKKFHKFDFEQVTIGGITTLELINHAISYYGSWRPDVLIMHTGINDIKTQLVRGLKLKFLSFTLKFLNFTKKKFKSNILYNSLLLRYFSVPKVDLNSFEKTVNKIKIRFKDSDIYWFEIYSDKNIDKERPGTKKNVEKYNKILKKNFNCNFIRLSELAKKKCFTNDGYHLNKTGHLKVFELISKIIR